MNFWKIKITDKILLIIKENDKSIQTVRILNENRKFENIEEIMFRWWTYMFITFGLLHGLIVLYLNRPNIRALFASQPSKPIA